MGLIIARWADSEDDGIYWMRDDEPVGYGETLFAVMTRYLTTGETMEILKYVPEIKTGPVSRDALVGVLTAEREAHKVAPCEPWDTGEKL
jgi:hypothetical protein